MSASSVGIRQHIMNINSIARLVFLSIITTGAASAWANSYKIVDLDSNFRAYGIDADGEVVGEHVSSKNGAYRALTYKDGLLHKERSRRLSATAVGVSRGRVVGNLFGDISQPVMWVRHGEMRALELPEGATGGVAGAINTSGDVAGYFYLANGDKHCFVWSYATQTSEDLGLLNNGQSCVAYGIDNRGHVYGSATSHPGSGSYAVVWRNGRLHRLPGLAPHGYATAVAGNKTGDVVGVSDTVQEHGGDLHAVLWRRGVPVDLMPGQDGWPGDAAAINDSGTIVGQVIEWGDDNHEYQAVRFDPDGNWIELEREVTNLGNWELWSATGVSDSGVIVGWGSKGGFMLVPNRDAGD